MCQPLISVIVPIYMIERYIGFCIESIIKQKYKNLEIILVVDGSKDRCSDICDLYALKDVRIKVIHKPNGGLVSARKAGLNVAKGDYIAYVDGDDWIDPHFIETLYCAAVSTDADMVCAGQTRELFTQTACFINVLPLGVYEDDKLCELWKHMISCGSFFRPGISTYVWNKLFKREILLKSQLTVDSRISIGEDGAVTYPALMKCRKVAVIDNVSYHYRQREDSMLKQSVGFADEARKLKYLYDYMMHWAETLPAEYNISRQITDYILSICIIRSGGRLMNANYSAFGTDYYGKNVIIYSAGTFGQQLVTRFSEVDHCSIAAWIDDDYWEYRRCCLNVDPVEAVLTREYDFIIIASVDELVTKRVIERLLSLGVSSDKILTVTVPDERTELLKSFLSTNK